MGAVNLWFQTIHSFLSLSLGSAPPLPSPVGYIGTRKHNPMDPKSSCQVAGTKLKALR